MRMVTISARCYPLLPEAIHRVSEGGKMAFSIRNLFYALRELYLKAYPGKKFYEYNSFTQDFMRSYEKKHGKPKGITRAKRGSYCYPSEWGGHSQADVKEGAYLWRGIANKIIVVEKEGLYDVMRDNNFDIRLDAIIMTTQGFTTEAGRELLIAAESEEIPVCILHDFDINGILIHTTLKEPTKRLDSFIEKVIDLGLNWKVIEKIRKSRDLTPEPVKLSKQDRSKLAGLLDRGEISEEAKVFLEKGRIELNALTPRELLDWLEERLEELDLWKTIPDIEELNKRLKERVEEGLDSTKRELVEELTDAVEESLGIDRIREALELLRSEIEDAAKEEVDYKTGEMTFPKMKPDQLERKMRESMGSYWTAIVDKIASKVAENLTGPVKERVEDSQDDMIEDVKDYGGVRRSQDNFKDTLTLYLGVV